MVSGGRIAVKAVNFDAASLPQGTLQEKESIDCIILVDISHEDAVESPQRQQTGINN